MSDMTKAEPTRPGFLDEIDRAKEDVASWPQWMKDAAHAAAATLPQAEPKREALSDDEILDIATAADLRFSMYSDDVETRAAIKRLARAVEQAAYEAAIKACDKIAGNHRQFSDERRRGAGMCSAEISALKEQK